MTAEERAIEKYPVEMYEEVGWRCVDKNSVKRKYFVEGYRQAEKDNELTWEDLETEIEQFFKPYFNIDGVAVKGLEYIYPKVEDLKDIARHFAEWQRKKDEKWLADNHKQIFNNGFEEGFEAGRDDMEEQLKKDAIDGEWFRCGIILPTEYNADDVKRVKITIWQDGV